MRRNSWMVSGLTMIIMAIAVVALITTGARWFLTARHPPADPVESGPLPKALADEIKRNEQAYYLRGINDAVEFRRLTGIVPDALVLQDALWARHRLLLNPLTPSEAHTMLQHVNPQQSLDSRLKTAQRIFCRSHFQLIHYQQRVSVPNLREET